MSSLFVHPLNCPNIVTMGFCTAENRCPKTASISVFMEFLLFHLPRILFFAHSADCCFFSGGYGLCVTSLEFKKLVGYRGAPELELLAVVIVLLAPILHETLTNSNFDANTSQLSHGSSLDCHKLKSISLQKCFADCFTDWHNILNEDVHGWSRSMLVTMV